MGKTHGVNSDSNPMPKANHIKWTSEELGSSVATLAALALALQQTSTAMVTQVKSR
jgi:hypothetical protein